MGVSDKVLELIKDEIEKDPEGRGYAGKTDLEICALLNDNYTVITQVEEIRPPRIYQILIGIANAPNVISDTNDIDLAKKYVKGVV